MYHIKSYQPSHCKRKQLLLDLIIINIWRLYNIRFFMLFLVLIAVHPLPRRQGSHEIGSDKLLMVHLYFDITIMR